MHRGDALPFWQQACAEKRPQRLRAPGDDRDVLLRRQRRAGRATSLGATTSRAGWCRADRERAFVYFSRACEARFQAGCVNLLDPPTPLRAESARVRSAAARARRRSQPRRHAGAGAVQRAPAATAGRFACEQAFGVAMTSADGVRRLAASHCGCRRASRGQRRAGAPSAAPADFVEIAAGPFTMGADSGSRSRGLRQRAVVAGGRQGTVVVPTFYIARHEVTVARVRGVRARARHGRSIARALAAPPTHPVDVCVVARRARLLPLARDDARSGRRRRRPRRKRCWRTDGA